MKVRTPSPTVLGGAALVAGFILSTAVSAGAVSPIPSAAPAPAPGRWRDVSLDDYRKHLGDLIPLVEACAKGRDQKSCDPMLVGPDDRISVGAERRLVRYGWLRVLFSKAEEPDQQAAGNANTQKETAGLAAAQGLRPTTTELLRAAEIRLTGDLAQASSPIEPREPQTQVRDQMNQVLAGRDFRGLQQISPRDTVMEKLNGWLNHLLESVTRLRARAAWIGRVLVWTFIVAVCLVLVVLLLQLERRWRVRLVPESKEPALDAPSARNWQFWLEDARRAAAAGLWREAIHFVYWAAISRLESRRLWPADRARTPREYLALVAAEDPRRAGLAALTGSFERVWYGGRDAVEGDYRRAEELATSLIEGGAA